MQSGWRTFRSALFACVIRDRRPKRSAPALLPCYFGIGLLAMRSPGREPERLRSQRGGLAKPRPTGLGGHGYPASGDRSPDEKLHSVPERAHPSAYSFSVRITGPKLSRLARGEASTLPT